MDSNTPNNAELDSCEYPIVPSGYAFTVLVIGVVLYKCLKLVLDYNVRKNAHCDINAEKAAANSAAPASNAD